MNIQPSSSPPTAHFDIHVPIANTHPDMQKFFTTALKEKEFIDIRQTILGTPT